jgi:Icc-related predicted phosphoesterase
MVDLRAFSAATVDVPGRAVTRVKPRLRCFGRVHSAYGLLPTKNTLFVNAAILMKKELLAGNRSYLVFRSDGFRTRGSRL